MHARKHFTDNNLLLPESAVDDAARQVIHALPLDDVIEDEFDWNVIYMTLDVMASGVNLVLGSMKVMQIIQNSICRSK